MLLAVPGEWLRPGARGATECCCSCGTPISGGRGVRACSRDAVACEKNQARWALLATGRTLRRARVRWRPSPGSGRAAVTSIAARDSLRVSRQSCASRSFRSPEARSLESERSSAHAGRHLRQRKRPADQRPGGAARLPRRARPHAGERQDAVSAIDGCCELRAPGTRMNVAPAHRSRSTPTRACARRAVLGSTPDAITSEAAALRESSSRAAHLRRIASRAWA